MTAQNLGLASDLARHLDITQDTAARVLALLQDATGSTETPEPGPEVVPEGGDDRSPQTGAHDPDEPTRLDTLRNAITVWWERISCPRGGCDATVRHWHSWLVPGDVVVRRCDHVGGCMCVEPRPQPEPWPTAAFIHATVTYGRTGETWTGTIARIDGEYQALGAAPLPDGWDYVCSDEFTLSGVTPLALVPADGLAALRDAAMAWADAPIGTPSYGRRGYDTADQAWLLINHTLGLGLDTTEDDVKEEVGDE